MARRTVQMWMAAVIAALGATAAGSQTAAAAGCKDDPVYRLFGGNAPYAYVTSTTAGLTSATVTVQITPEELSVQYHLEYGSSYQFSTPATPLGQCDGTATVQIPLTGLQPGTTYDLRIVLTSVAGTSTNAGQAFSTQSITPTGPPYKLTLKASKRSILVNGGVTLTGRLLGSNGGASEWQHGDIASDYVVNLQWNLGHGGWRDFDFTSVGTHGGLTFGNGPTTLDRNTRFRLQSDGTLSPVKRPPAYSNVLTVYVYPTITVNASRTSTGQVIATYGATVYAGARYRRQRVYFYIRPNGSRRVRLVGSGRLRESGDQLVAGVTFNVAGAGFVLACTRHQLVANMGKPFYFRACGRRNGRV